jgi:hypothetical protein
MFIHPAMVMAFDPSLTMGHQGWDGRSALESPTEKEPLPKKKRFNNGSISIYLNVFSSST